MAGAMAGVMAGAMAYSQRFACESSLRVRPGSKFLSVFCVFLCFLLCFFCVWRECACCFHLHGICLRNSPVTLGEKKERIKRVCCACENMQTKLQSQSEYLQVPCMFGGRRVLRVEKIMFSMYIKEQKKETKKNGQGSD